MQILAASLLFLLSALASAETEFNKITPEESDELKKSCGSRPMYDPDEYKIYSGHRAKPGQFPWAVDIGMYGEGFCGGTLITKRHVLTAGHCTHGGEYPCFDIMSPSGYEIFIGGLKQGKGRKFGVKSLTSYPYWSSEENRESDCSSGGDLAIYELDQDVPDELIKSGKAGFGCLPAPDFEFGKHKMVAHGWGNTLDASTKFDLMWTHMFPLNKEECSRRYESAPDDTICVAEVNSDVCAGDSGGPLLQMTGKGSTRRYVVVGVVSFGTDCKKIKKALEGGVDDEEYSGGVFTDVRAYLEWICEKTGACYTVKK